MCYEYFVILIANNGWYSFQEACGLKKKIDLFLNILGKSINTIHLLFTYKLSYVIDF